MEFSDRRFGSRAAAEQLTEHVLGIVADAMFDQQFDELFLKGSFSVMLFLVFNVVRYRGDI